jgi:hypothetical protein
MNYAFLDTTYRLETHRTGDWDNFQIKLYYYAPPIPPTVGNQEPPINYSAITNASTSFPSGTNSTSAGEIS